MWSIALEKQLEIKHTQLGAVILKGGKRTERPSRRESV